jgi:FixJ family two-component response regulator
LPNGKRVFVVDDDLVTLRAIGRTLLRHGYDSLLFPSVWAFANEHGKLKEALCVLLEIDLDDGRSGIELRHRLRDAGHDPVIFMTGNDSPAVRKAALESGCIAYLIKPVSPRSLIGPLERASNLGQPSSI